MARIIPKKLSFSSAEVQVAVNSGCYFWGFMLGLDGTNDPTITFFDSGTTTTTNKTEVVPSNTYDASALGLNGAMFPERVECKEGIAVSMDALGAGACEVTVLYS